MPTTTPLAVVTIGSSLGMDTSLGGGIESVDLRGVLRGDGPTAELQGRGELLAARLPEGGQDREALDLLDPGQLLVGMIDAVLDDPSQTGVLGQNRRIGRQPVLLRVRGGQIRVESDQATT